MKNKNKKTSIFSARNQNKKIKELRKFRWDRFLCFILIIVAILSVISIIVLLAYLGLLWYVICYIVIGYLFLMAAFYFVAATVELGGDLINWLYPRQFNEK